MNTPNNTPLLGLAMIVKGAEGRIGRLLKSLLETPKGPAFDEFVIVDTGDSAAMRAEIVKAFWPNHTDPESYRFDNAETYALIGGRTIRIVLGSYQDPDPVTLSDGTTTISDFAAARNFSFSLTRSLWIAWLDHDDMWPKCEYVRAYLEKLTKEKPHINCVTIPYSYSAGMGQDKFRILKWGNGDWEWVDEIHEWPSTRDRRRVLAKVNDPPVIHEKTDNEGMRSTERNTKICARAREKALAAGNKEKAALMAYYIGLCLNRQAEMDNKPTPREAYVLLAETGSVMAFQNIGAYAYVEIARAKLRENDFQAASLAAAAAHSYCPEIPEGLGMLGVVHTQRGDFLRAAQLFDLFFGRKIDQSLPLSQNDVALTEGWFRAYAALAYHRVGRTVEAIDLIGKVHPAARFEVNFNQVFMDINTELQKAKGLIALGTYVEYLIQNTEPQKALQVIKDYAPAAVEDMKEVAELYRGVEARIPHCRDWKQYKKVYDEMPSEEHSFNPSDHQIAFILQLGRCRGMVEWAKNLKTTHPDKKEITLLSVGFQSGIIETQYLSLDERIKLTVIDASERADASFEILAAKFPGRVSYHQVKDHHWDWPEGQYDAVTFMEVLEHVPNPEESLAQLRKRVAPGGTLFLSTPVADHWVEEYLTNPNTAPKHLYHIQAFGPTKLWKMLRKAGFWIKRATSTDQGTQYFTQSTPETDGWLTYDGWQPTRQLGKLSIYVPDTPLPFDPDSVHREHVGGSEEAVIYLAPELARLGFEVTVYSPRPKRTDDTLVHMQDNVLWRDSKEFDFEGDHENVLFWRCPQVMQIDVIKKAKYKKFQWLHDATYYADQNTGATPAGIAAASEHYGSSDKVICLTKAHAAAIRKWDGYAGSNIAFAANGIRVSDFPVLTPEIEAQRDPHKVVWGASPDRGLHTLLALWPQVRKEVPTATLDVYYAWGQLVKRNPKAASELKAMIDDLNAKGLGVTLKGGVSHDELHAAYRKASVYAYSTTFYEIYCISAVKAAASGCVFLTLAHGSLPEVVVGDSVLPRTLVDEKTIESPEGQEAYAKKLVAILKSPPSAATRGAMSEAARKTYGWDKAAKMFEAILLGTEVTASAKVLAGSAVG